MRVGRNTDVTRLHLQMHKTVLMEKCERLSRVQQIRDQSRKRHRTFLVILEQRAEVSGLDVWFSKIRSAVCRSAQFVYRDQIGMAKSRPKVDALEELTILVRAIREIDHDLPA